jgi:hypothetical protein
MENINLREIETKYCAKCSETLTKNKFYTNRCRGDNCGTYCIDCTKRMLKERTSKKQQELFNNEYIENEIWKIIPSYKNYMASNKGRIKRIKTNRILQGCTSLNGYHIGNIAISANNKKNIKFHRIVAETFIPNPDNKPVVNHIDGNKLNNMIENLEWCTYSENTKHAVDNGLIKSRKKSIKKYTYDLKNLQHEKWKEIRYIPGFMVSNKGRIKGKHKLGQWGGFKNYITNGNLSGYGYLRFEWKSCDKIKSKSVHRIVAETFIPNPDNKPVVNHIDGNKSNNIIENLEWCTYSENTKHAVDNGFLNIRKNILQLDLNGNIINEFNSIKEGKNYLNLYKGCIDGILNGRSKTHKGFTFCYKKDYINNKKVQLYNNNKTKIKQINIETGEITIWNGICDAAKHLSKLRGSTIKTIQSNISKQLRNKNKCYNSTWNYLNK